MKTHWTYCLLFLMSKVYGFKVGLSPASEEIYDETLLQNIADADYDPVAYNADITNFFNTAESEFGQIDENVEYVEVNKSICFSPWTVSPKNILSFYWE